MILFSNTKDKEKWEHLSETDPAIAAYHEAGHLIAYLHFDKGTRGPNDPRIVAKIFKKPIWVGFADEPECTQDIWEPGKEWGGKVEHFERELENTEERAIVDLSGPVAELTYIINQFGLKAAVVVTCAASYEPGSDDYEVVKEIKDDKKILELLEKTKQLVENNWTGIKAIAGHLAKHEAISLSDAMLFFLRAGDWKKELRAKGYNI